MSKEENQERIAWGSRSQGEGYDEATTESSEVFECVDGSFSWRLLEISLRALARTTGKQVEDRSQGGLKPVRR